MRLLLPLLAVGSLMAAEPVVPAGFTALFDGKSLAGWWGAGTENPRVWQALTAEDFAKKQAASLADIKAHWTVQDGELINDGAGLFLTSDKQFRDFELRLEYRIVAKADSGIYLKGCPQVQIWDCTNQGNFDKGAGKGSGGLWNNSEGAPGKDPLVLADKPFGEWNAMRVIQCGSRTWVWLNDKTVVDGAIMENDFDRKLPVPPMGPIQLQTHGGEIRWRNVVVREVPAEEANRLLRGKDPEGFVNIFNGKDLTGWAGPVDEYEVKDGAVVCKPGKGGTIYFNQDLSDFIVRVEIKLPPGGNNGLAIRYPGHGDTAYVGMCELQVLDDTAPKYFNKLHATQYHGSAYGMQASHRGYQRPVGEWNYEEVTVKGSTLRVELNGTRILDDCDVSTITTFKNEKESHPGKSLLHGFFGFAGHDDPVMFRNIAIKKLP